MEILDLQLNPIAFQLCLSQNYKKALTLNPSIIATGTIGPYPAELSTRGFHNWKARGPGHPRHIGRINAAQSKAGDNKRFTSTLLSYALAKLAQSVLVGWMPKRG